MEFHFFFIFANLKTQCTKLHPLTLLPFTVLLAVQYKKSVVAILTVSMTVFTNNESYMVSMQSTRKDKGPGD